MIDLHEEGMEDASETRDQIRLGGPISELEYARLVAAAVAHAAKPRPGPALPPWVCVGPRNLGGRMLSLAQDPARPLTLYGGSAHGGLWRTTDGGDTWQHVGPPSFNTPIGALAIHPARPLVLFVGTGSVSPAQASGDGLFRITFAPAVAPVIDRLAPAPGIGEAPQASANGAAARYTRIECDPEDPERFWAASNTGLWRREIGGAPPVERWVRDLPPAAGVPANLPNLIAQAGLGIESAFPAFVTDLRVALDPRDTSTVVKNGRAVRRYLVLYAAVQEAGVFRGRYDRNDDSVTWDAQRTLVPNAPRGTAFGRVLLALCRHQPRHVFAVFETFDDGVSRASNVVATEDSGDHWALRGRIALADNNQAFFSMAIEVHPDDPRVLACGTVNLSLSHDGGSNFTPILEWPHYNIGDHAQHADQHALLFDAADRRRLWVGNDGGISVAYDIGRSDGAATGYWRKRSHGIVAGQFQDVTVHPTAALAFMSAGGLQDNGSWVGYGGPTWYHCGVADGGAIAIHAGNPRQFLVSQQAIVTLGTVTAALPTEADAVAPPIDPLPRIPALQLFVIRAPVLNDLPLADPWIRVRRDRYLPTRALNDAGLAGPFVGLLEQDPRPANAGQALYGFRFGNVTGEPRLHQTAALTLAVPPAPAALPATPATLPVPPASPSELPVALVQRVVLPGPALDPGDEASAIAFGPNPGAAPPLVEGWIGTARGRLFHTNDAPLAAAPNPWTVVPPLPVPGNIVHAVSRFAVHPANPAVVAVAAVPADREFFVQISTAGAPGVTRIRVSFANPDGSFPVLQPPVPANAAFTALAGTPLFLSFPDAAYTLGQAWRVSVNGEVRPGRGLFGFGFLNVEARVTIIRAGGPRLAGQAAGLPGTAQYQFELRAGAGFGPPSAAIEAERGFARMLNTTMFLRFTAGAYSVGESWIVAIDARVRPAATLNVLPAFGRAIDILITPPGGALGVARFTFQVAGLPVQAALLTGAAVELPGTGVVLCFSGGPFVAGHHWTVQPDNRVVPVGVVAGNVELLARLRGRVFLTHDRGANWTDISFPRTRPPAAFDADAGSLPPGPVTSLRFDAVAAGTALYAGTLAGVYTTAAVPLVPPVAPAVIDQHWRPFNGPAGQELPLTLVNDIELVPGTRRLRAATFGRGLWDCDVAGALPQRQLVIRQTLIEDGLTYPRPFPPPIPDDPRLPATQVWLDHAHAFDIRVDSAPFKFFDEVVDGVEFDEQLGVDALVPLAPQAVYVQVHNRGWDVVRNVDVHLLYAPAGVAVPVLMGGAAPAASMPAGLPDPDSAINAAGFVPPGASPWRRVGPSRRIAELRPWEPVVLRFDWTPPQRLAPAAADNWAALLALCSAADDPLPTPLAVGTSMAAFIAAERRAALRVVPVQPRAPSRLFIRDGIDDDIRLGSVAFAGRSPDIIVVSAEPAAPATAFADLLDTRPQDVVRLGAANQVYVRVHNKGLSAVDADLRLWALALDPLQQPRFRVADWTALVPAAGPFPTASVPAGGTALLHVTWPGPTHPDASGLRTLALVAVIRSVDDTDPLPDVATIDSLEKFWDFFGRFFGSDNAALRVLKVVQ